MPAQKMKMAVAIAALLATAGAANAATMTVTEYVSPATVNLTTEGTLDWAKAAGPQFTPTVTTRMAGALELSDFTCTNGYPSADGPGPTTFSWSNGGSPASGSNAVVRNTWGGDVWSITARGDTNERILKVYYGTVWNWGGAQVTLALPGASTQILTAPDNGTGSIDCRVYEIHYTADTAGDLLSVSLTGNAGVYAATLSAVPEPTSLAVIGLGLASVVGLRRRRVV